ncbi:MAG: cytochrome c [Magnetococcales bacterium]|nr:cytochrome c [Magnetococcales bacterium]
MRKTILSLSIAVIPFLLVAPASADESNPSIIHRQGIYSAVGGHMKAIKSILLLEFDAAKDVTFHAQGIVDAFTHMGNSFPPGSDKGETKAKPEIWTDKDKFAQLGKNAFGAANELLKVAQGGDKQVTLAAFKKLGETCKSCHDDFKNK